MILGIATVCGCAHIPAAPRAAAPLPLPDALAAYYDYPHAQIQAIRTLVEDAGAFRVWRIQFPLSAPADLEPTEPVVELEWYETAAPGHRPAILFNPILGGDYPIERGMCRFFASHGFHVALVHRKTLKVSPDKPVSHLELLLRQGVIRIRQVVDWMQTQDRVDPQRLGSFGLSMGGIVSVITAAVEPRFRCHVVALAGGSIPDIVISSHDKLLAKPRTRYLEHNHLSLHEFDQQLRQAIKSDPITLAPYVKTDHLFLMLTMFDRTIGRANVLRLWRALGKPEAEFIPTGHYTAYLYLPYLKRRSLAAFRHYLEPS